MYELKTESSFDAAHFLTNYHGKCENLHGHRWRVVAYLRAGELEKSGTNKDMIVDFAQFKSVLRGLTEIFDHTFVVEEGSLAKDTLECLEREGFTLSVVPFRTTAENFARYFVQEISGAGLPVSQVDVYETPNNCASYFVGNVTAECESTATSPHAACASDTTPEHAACVTPDRAAGSNATPATTKA